MTASPNQLYKQAFYEKTTEHFNGRFVQPALVSQPQSKPGLDVCAFGCDDGLWVTTTVGNAVGAGSETLGRERFEVCALTAAPIDDVVAMVATLAMDFRHAQPPLSPFDKLHYADAAQVPFGRFFLLDAGALEGPFVVQRLLAVPVTEAEYDRFLPRDQVDPADGPQALRILGLSAAERPLRRLPVEHLRRWL